MLEIGSLSAWRATASQEHSSQTAAIQSAFWPYRFPSAEHRNTPSAFLAAAFPEMRFHQICIGIGVWFLTPFANHFLLRLFLTQVSSSSLCGCMDFQPVVFCQINGFPWIHRNLPCSYLHFSSQFTLHLKTAFLKHQGSSPVQSAICHFGSLSQSRIHHFASRAVQELPSNTYDRGWPHWPPHPQ